MVEIHRCTILLHLDDPGSTGSHAGASEGQSGPKKYFYSMTKY